jgi:hypothetical protein
MGVPYSGDNMTSHQQYITVRNDRGAEMLASLGDKLVRAPTVDRGDRRSLVMQVSPEPWAAWEEPLVTRCYGKCNSLKSVCTST